MSCYVSHESQIGSYLQEFAWLVQIIQTGWQFPQHFHFFIQKSNPQQTNPKNSRTFESHWSKHHSKFPSYIVHFFSTGIAFSLLDLFLSMTEPTQNKPSIKWNASLTQNNCFILIHKGNSGREKNR